MIENNFNENFDVDTVLGRSVEANGKIFHPIIRISILRDTKGDMVGSWVVPFAFVVEENGEKYVISLTDEKFNQDELLKMV